MNEDLTLFTPDELYANEPKRRPKETVDLRFRRIYSLSPLEYLIRVDEKIDLRGKARRLTQIMEEHLSFRQYYFIMSLLGSGWTDVLRLPFELRHLSTEEFEESMVGKMPEVAEKVDILLDYCGESTLTNRMPAVQRVLAIPYSIATQEKIVDTYEAVRQGRLSRYPHNFFHPENVRLPKILTRHFVDGVVQMPRTAETAEQLTVRDFHEHGLQWMLSQYFKGNIPDALRHAYTREEFPAVYNGAAGDYKPKDVLREIFNQLEPIQPKREEEKTYSPAAQAFFDLFKQKPKK